MPVENETDQATNGVARPGPPSRADSCQFEREGKDGTLKVQDAGRGPAGWPRAWMDCAPDKSGQRKTQS